MSRVPGGTQQSSCWVLIFYLWDFFFFIFVLSSLSLNPHGRIWFYPAFVPVKGGCVECIELDQPYSLSYVSMMGLVSILAAPNLNS
jgi:hypothetical protein